MLDCTSDSSTNDNNINNSTKKRTMARKSLVVIMKLSVATDGGCFLWTLPSPNDSDRSMLPRCL